VTGGIEIIHRDDHRRGAGARGEQRLRGAEHERRGHANAVRGEPVNRLDGVLDERHLDDHVVGKLGELAAVAVRVLRRHRVHGRQHRPFDESRDLPEPLSIVLDVLRVRQRMRGEHAFDEPTPRRPADVVEIRRGEIELHADSR
jgi:hypothetical protein